MAQIEASNDDGIQVNEHTGNMRIGPSADVNTILRSLMKRKRITRLDLLGRTEDQADD